MESAKADGVEARQEALHTIATALSGKAEAAVKTMLQDQRPHRLTLGRDGVQPIRAAVKAEADGAADVVPSRGTTFEWPTQQSSFEKMSSQIIGSHFHEMMLPVAARFAKILASQGFDKKSLGHRPHPKNHAVRSGWLRVTGTAFLLAASVYAISAAVMRLPG